jgi:hypothetical protein
MLGVSNHQARQGHKSAVPESYVSILPEKRRDTVHSGGVVDGDEAHCETRAPWLGFPQHSR